MQEALKTFLLVSGYCVLAVGVAALVERATRKLWLFLIASSMASTLALILADVAYLGFFDTSWYVVIFPALFIAIGCAFAYWVIKKRFFERESNA